MHSTETKAEFLQLRAAGWSLVRISKKLGVSRATLVKWNSDFYHPISCLRAVELEALHESILADQQEDLNRLTRHQKVLAKELSRRKLSSIPTHKLFQLDSLLRQEITKVRDATLLTRHGSTYIPQPEHPMLRQAEQPADATTSPPISEPGADAASTSAPTSKPEIHGLEMVKKK